MKIVFFKAVFIIFAVSHTASHKRSKRMIGGQEAKHPHPWFVVLKIDKTKSLKCGGTIIDKLWILTAAHCIDGQTSIFLEFGTEEFDYYDIAMTANEFFIHPHYKKTHHNDVALIKLPVALNFSKNISPINLVSISDRNKNFEGSKAYVYGYGITDDYLPDDFSVRLLYGAVTVISNKICQTQFKNGVVVESILCAKGLYRSDTSICQGDSGGPLTTINSQGEVILIGLSLFAKEDDCMSGFPSGFARVTYYLEFIHNRTDIGYEDEIDSNKTFIISYLIFLISHSIFLFLTKQILKHLRLSYSLKIIFVLIYFVVFIFYLRAIFLWLIKNLWPQGKIE